MSQEAIRARIREIVRLRHPGVIVKSSVGEEGKVAPVAEGGFLPLLPLLATTLAPAVGSLVNYGVKKLTGNAMPGKAKRPPTKWSLFVKWFSASNGMKFRDALKVASPHWKAKDEVFAEWEASQSKGGSMPKKPRKPRAKKVRGGGSEDFYQ